MTVVSRGLTNPCHVWTQARLQEITCAFEIFLPTFPLFHRNFPPLFPLLPLRAHGGHTPVDHRHPRVMQLRSGYGVGLRSEPQRSRLTPEQIAQIARGVRVVLGQWTALQLALSNMWGGPESHGKAQALATNVTDWLLDSKEVYADELEDLLDAELLDSWNTQAEDDSPREVAALITRVFYETLQGQGDTLNFLASRATSAQRQLEQSLDQAQQMQQQQQQAAAMEHRPSQPRPKPTVDEDGWTTVPSRRG